MLAPSPMPAGSKTETLEKHRYSTKKAARTARSVSARHETCSRFLPPNDIEFTGEKEGAPATDAESGAMSCYTARRHDPTLMMLETGRDREDDRNGLSVKRCRLVTPLNDCLPKQIREGRVSCGNGAQKGNRAVCFHLYL